MESDEEEEARDENKAGKKENDKEDNDDVYEDMNGFHNLFREGVGGVQQKFKGPSSGDYKDERDEEKMNGNDSNKKGKLDENQEKSDRDLEEDLMNDMLAQVISAKASSSSTGQKVYVMLTKDKSEHKTLIIWNPKLSWIFVPEILAALLAHAARKTTSLMVLERTSSLTWRGLTRG